MRKLTEMEQAALSILVARGYLVPGDLSGPTADLLREALKGLVRKHYATASDTDDGARWEPTAAGLAL